MLYPEKLNRKKSDLIIKIAIVLSILVALLLIFLNQIMIPNIHWAGLANAGIVYVWITIIYAINRNTNIAAHVLVQTITISILTVYIDYKTGFNGWSINVAVPIIFIIANVTMLVLTIVSYKKYIRYAIYQLLICILSLIPYVFIYEHLVKNVVISYVATGISFLNFIVTICLCAKDVKEAIIRKFHV